MTQPPTTAAGTLASFATSLNLDDVDAGVVEKTKLHLLDTLGAAIAGADSPEATAARGAYGAGSAAGAGIIGTSLSYPVQTAAVLNGIAAHAWELDDTGGCDHSGAVVVPAVLAAASLRPVSGAEVIRAVIVGYDIAGRVLDASGGYSACNAVGWHSTGTCGSFGAAAGAATILGLDTQAHTWALGLAGSFTGGLWAFTEDGAMSKRLHAGRAAEGGLTSALLAREGFTGPTAIFEAQWGGYFATYVPDVANPEELLTGLGESWLVERAAIKPHSSCRDTHSAIDVVLDHPELSHTAVTGLTVTMSRFAAQMCGGTVVNTTVEAQMSLPYCVAAALVHRRVGLREISAEVRSDPRVVDVLARIRIEVDDDRADDEHPELTFHLTDGSTRSFAGQAPLGSGDRPMTADEIVAKFTELAGPVLGRHHAQRLADATLTLEQQASADQLLNLLRSDAVPRH